MSFQEAVQTVLTQKYADFSGRARRSEYWWFFLFNLIVSIVASIIDRIVGLDGVVGSYGVLQLLVGLAFLIPGLAVAVRRLHDTGRSGWWVLIAIIPVIGWIVIIVFLALDGEPQPNQYGPSPKGAGYPV
ncbi:DUF805 domain-containing protein [Spongisporangium articulatum]|uniref:DUF805 domain-containing protein n=1 Tax=Spongisporangium articulatum TaxID=3362603 RepID=A0ABW8AJS8_9ACTN